MSKTVRVKLFGAFRSYGEHIELSVKEPVSVKDLKRAMKEKIDASDVPILEASAFSDDKHILQEDYILDDIEEVAILPPVCGG